MSKPAKKGPTVEQVAAMEKQLKDWAIGYLNSNYCIYTPAYQFEVDWVDKATGHAHVIGRLTPTRAVYIRNVRIVNGLAVRYDAPFLL